MIAKFFRFPFAVSGDKLTVPDPAQGDGSVSYIQGFGPDYERDPTSDPLAKRVPRDGTNELFYDITANLRDWQISAYPEWVPASLNGGTAVSYPYSTRVRYDAGSGYRVYASIINNNTLVPSDPSGWVADDPNPITFATAAETQAGVIANKAVTPAGLATLTATASRAGLIPLATQAEVAAGVVDSKAVSPATLATLTALPSRAGLVQLAGPSETQAGVVDTKAVTPAGLATLTATATRAGLVELATAAETQTGTDATRAVTPAGLVTLTAMTSRVGLVQLAGPVETQDGVDTTKAVTPAGLAAVIATPSRAGLVPLATPAETRAGTVDNKAVTPQGLVTLTGDQTRAGLLQIASAGETQDGTDNTKAVSPQGLSARTATLSRTGIAAIASIQDVRDGTANDVIVTPNNLAGLFFLGARGTYAMLYHPTAVVNPGDVYAGSALRWAGVSQSSGAADVSSSTTAPPGTEWVAVGKAGNGGDGNSRYATMWYRRA